MDPSMNIDSLLTAARLLDKDHLFTGLTNLNLAALPSSVPISTSVSHIVPDVYFPNEFQENLQPASIPGKMKSERKCSSASTSAAPYCSILQRKTSTKSSRAAHNELEKTRRANLRSCLEKLKTLVPLVSDAARNTTLALLTRARDHIQYLDASNTQLHNEVSVEKEKNALLLMKLERLRAEKARQEESVSTESSQSSRVSPNFLEYSPSTKPANSPRQVFLINPYDEGLLPTPFFMNSKNCTFHDLNPLPASQNTTFLPIHLSV